MSLIQKPAFQIAIVMVIATGVGAAIYLQKKSEAKPEAPKAANKTLGEIAPEEVTTLRGEVTRQKVEGNVDRLILPREKAPPKAPQPPDPVKTISKKTQPNTEEQRQELPSLVHVEQTIEPTFEPQAPSMFGPRGLLIRAALVLTVDSSSLDTPVLALVSEDVYWNGELLLPAGTQVFAKASNGKSRDRIEVNGEFTFVWADGREYKIKGIALDHEMEDDGTFAISDGSAGIRGEIIKTDKHAELKLIVASVVSGIGDSAQETFQTAFGEQAENNATNSVLDGVSDAGEQYAELLLSKIADDLTYVRVTAGTQFYIFTEDVFEPNLASVAGFVQGNEAVSSLELQQRAYENALTQSRADQQRALESRDNKGGNAAAEENLRRRKAADSSEAYLDRISSLLNSSQNFTNPIEGSQP